jgi:AbrB family looped-hinge helix DNA binding protein
MHALTIKGQVTLPVKMRRAVGLRPGDKVRFALKNGEIRLRPAAKNDGISAIFGIIKSNKPFPTPAQIQKIREDAAVSRYLRAVGLPQKRQSGKKPRRGRS